MTSSILIDNVAFAKAKQLLVGQLAVSECARLQDWLNRVSPDVACPQDQIDFQLQGNVNAIGQYFLQLKLNAAIQTNCQRCLTAMTTQLNLVLNYQLSAYVDDLTESETLAQDDDVDWLSMDKAMNLTALIEDELIMAMPIAPVHDFACSDTITQSGDKPNPFAKLKGFIKG